MKNDFSMSIDINWSSWRSRPSARMLFGWKKKFFCRHHAHTHPCGAIRTVKLHDCLLSVYYKRSPSSFHRTQSLLEIPLKILSVYININYLWLCLSIRLILLAPTGMGHLYTSTTCVCLFVIFTVHLLLFEQGPGKTERGEEEEEKNIEFFRFSYTKGKKC